MIRFHPLAVASILFSIFPFQLHAAEAPADERVRHRLMEIRSQLGESLSVKQKTVLLQEADRIVSIPRFRDQTLGQSVTPLLAHPDENVRLAALTVLLRLRYTPAAAEVRRLAASDPDRFVRAHAAAAVADIEGQAAAPFLQELLTDRDPIVQLYAAAGLGRVGIDTGLKLALEKLSDSDETVRDTAAIALGQIGRPEAELPLQDAHTNGRIASSIAHESLVRIGVAAQAAPDAKALYLSGVLKHSKIDRRQAAAWLLAELETPEALAALKTVAKNPAHPGYTEARQVAIQRMIIPPGEAEHAQ